MRPILRVGQAWHSHHHHVEIVVEAGVLRLGLLVREVCVAQSYDWGVEAQVDWY